MINLPPSTAHLSSPSHPLLLFPMRSSLPSPPEPPVSSSTLSQIKPSRLSSSFLPSKFFQSLSNKQSHIPNFLPDSLGTSASPAYPDDARCSKCVKLLRFSARYGDAELAKAVHGLVLKLEQPTFLLNALIIAYLKLGLVSDAYAVFSDVLDPDVVSYTAFISVFAKTGYEFDAVQLFFEMRESGVEPNAFTLVALLTACNRVMGLKLGLQVHALAVKLGFLCNIYVDNAIMGVYVKCGYLDTAFELFDKMPERDVASWNTVLTGAAGELMYERVFQLFRMMQKVSFLRADHVTLSSVLNACAECRAFRAGREVHSYALKTGFEGDLSVDNATIGFYTKCGGLEDVETLFSKMRVKDIFTWTSMITAYMEFGRVDLAIETFDRMPKKNTASYNALLAGLCHNKWGAKAIDLFCRMVVEGMELTDHTLTSAIAASSLLMRKDLSEEIHGFVIKFGFGSNACIEAALFDMFTRCGRISDALKVLNRMAFDRISSVDWTSMICGYTRNGQLEEALNLFQQGQLEGTMVLDEVTSTVVLSICGTLGFEHMGKQIHCHALKSQYLDNLGVVNGIIIMYSKCYNMEDSIKAFNTMPSRDTVPWNSLITGHLLHRQGDEGLSVWSKMEIECVKPDPVTFVLVISSYMHTKSNLVRDCQRLFHSMKAVYNIEPTSDHYAALVSVLGRWACLEEAEGTIAEMPFEPGPSVWRALLNGCKFQLNSEIGKRTIKRILGMEPLDHSTHILVSNIYSASGRWHCSDMVRAEMRRKGFQKHPARCWVVHRNKVHSFHARDKSHFQTKDINRVLEILVMECLKAGYVPDTSFVLHEVDEYQKNDFLFYHSAKLAVTYALLVTRTGRPVRVSKNILLCGDCHNFLKYVSIVTKRDICLRDTSGFHLLSNGVCSCKDHW